MNLYIPIEMKVRELEGKALLAFVAAERGHSVILGAKTDTLVAADKGDLPPGIVHMKSITPSESTLRQLERFHQHGHLVTCQDEEGGIIDEKYDTFGLLRFSEESLGLTDQVFGWGEFDTDSLKGLFPGYSKIMNKAGSPRADFWRPELKSYHSKVSPDPDNSDRPFILVSSNFGGMLNENRIWNIFARLREAGYFDRDPSREEHEYENASYQIRLIGQFIKLIRHLAKTFPQIDILVRPHPVESVDAWEKLIGSYPNIIVRREGSITPWIHSSLMVLHNGCTTAMEAAVCGVPGLAFRPFPSPIEREIPNKVSRQAFSIEEATDMVDIFLKEGRFPADPEHDKLVNHILASRFANLTGPLGADNIVDAWETLAKESKLPHTSPEQLLESFNAKHRVSSTSVARIIKGGLSKMISILSKEEEIIIESGELLNTKYKFRDFSEEEIQSVLSNLQKVLGRFGNVRYKRYGEKSFVVYSDGA